MRAKYWSNIDLLRKLMNDDTFMSSPHRTSYAELVLNDDILECSCPLDMDKAIKLPCSEYCKTLIAMTDLVRDYDIIINSIILFICVFAGVLCTESLRDAAGTQPLGLQAIHRRQGEGALGV